MDWITLTVLLTILGCVIKTSSLKYRISGIFLIILILFIDRMVVKIN